MAEIYTRKGTVRFDQSGIHAVSRRLALELMQGELIPFNRNVSTACGRVAGREETGTELGRSLADEPEDVIGEQMTVNCTVGQNYASDFPCTAGAEVHQPLVLIVHPTIIISLAPSGHTSTLGI
jgi:hypothetical protein